MERELYNKEKGVPKSENSQAQYYQVSKLHCAALPRIPCNAVEFSNENITKERIPILLFFLLPVIPAYKIPFPVATEYPMFRACFSPITVP